MWNSLVFHLLEITTTMKILCFENTIETILLKLNHLQ
jgi:hypothetical protein